MEQLFLSRNGINNICGLDALKNLKILALQNNMIQSISGLEELSELEELYLGSNTIQELSGLSKNVFFHMRKSQSKNINTCRQRLEFWMSVITKSRAFPGCLICMNFKNFGQTIMTCDASQNWITCRLAEI